MATLSTVRFTIKGTSPLLMHNERLANPFDPLTKSIAQITAKGRRQTEEDRWAIQRFEWEGGLYWGEGIGPYIPGANLKKCLRNAATAGKLGKAFLQALTPLDAEIPLIYPGPRDIDGLWKAETFIDVRAVKVSGKVQRARPRFNDWGLVTNFLVNTTLINLDALRYHAEHAGIIEGLGDYRPTFGRFVCQVEEAA